MRTNLNLFENAFKLAGSEKRTSIGKLSARVNYRNLFLDEKKILGIELKKFLEKNPKPTTEQIDKALDSIWIMPDDWEKESTATQIPLIRQQIRRINDAFDVFKKLAIKNPELGLNFIKVLYEDFYQSLLDPSGETTLANQNTLDFARKIGFIVNPKIESALRNKTISKFDLNELGIKHFFLPAKVHEQAITEGSQNYNDLKSFLEPLTGTFEMKIPPLVECDLGTGDKRIEGFSNGTYILFNTYSTGPLKVEEAKKALKEVKNPEFEKQILSEVENYRDEIVQHELIHHFLGEIFPDINSFESEIIAKAFNTIKSPYLLVSSLLTADPAYIGPVARLSRTLLSQALISKRTNFNCEKNDPLSVTIALFKTLGLDTHKQFISQVQNLLQTMPELLVDQIKSRH